MRWQAHRYVLLGSSNNGASVKPGDFYVRSRQFFGFLLPGTLWLAAAGLALSTQTIAGLLTAFANMSAIGAVLFLAFAFAIGLVTQRTFDLTYAISRFITKRVPSLARRDKTDALSDRGFYIARETIRAMGREPTDDGKRALQSIAEAEIAAGLWAERRAHFLICKSFLIARQSALVARMMEAEDEISLVGMLPMPFAACMVGLWLRAPELAAMGLRGSLWGWRIGLPAALIAGEYMLFRLFRHLRRHETRDGFRSFVVETTMTATLSAESATHDAPLQDRRYTRYEA